MNSDEKSGKLQFTDLTLLDEFTSYRVSLKKDLLNCLIEEIPNDVTRLSEAIESKDWNEVHELSHKIRPSFQMIGTPDLKDKLLAIETYSKAEVNLDAISGLLKWVSNAVPAILKELQFELDRLNNEFPGQSPASA